MTALVESNSRLQSSTLAALRYPNFRLYFVGQLISLSGTWMQVVAQGWLVFHLTQSELWLGIVACAAGLPSLLLSPFAGVILDRTPRRRILLTTRAAQMALALALGLLTLAGVVQVWHIVALALLLGVTNSMDAPARQTIIVDLVGHDDLSSGIALNSIMFNGSRIIGPTIAGIALTQVGPAWCFFLNGLFSLGVIFSLLVMQVTDNVAPGGEFAPLRRLREGLGFSRRHPTIAPLLLLAVIGSVFASNLSTLLPAFADEVLNSPEEAYAAMSAAMGIGAVVAGVTMTTLAKHFGRGRVVSAMIVFTMLISTLATRTTDIPVAVFLMALFGFSIILQFVTMNTLIQSEVPDSFRGRVMSLYTLTFFGLAPFGALALGATADVIGTPDALALFALAGGALGLAVLARFPRVRRLL